MLSLMSIPQTRPAGPTAWAMSVASRPGPLPMSSTASPAVNPSSRSTSRRCWTTSAVR
jgi:hypothetical protein